jgi:hypothetical protein
MMMEPQIWLKSQEKWAYILVLRGHEVHRLKVTGNVLTLKRNVQRVLEALQQGQDPANVGIKSVEALDARTIGKAEVSPGNGSLTLHGGEGGSRRLSFSTADSSADDVLQTILAQSGRAFRPAREAIGVVEALVPPAIIGVLGGLFWAGLYQSAGKLASGEVVEVRGRRQGLQRLMNSAAEILGTNGTIAVGALLLAFVLGWAGMRVVRRPECTVWLPEAV